MSGRYERDMIIDNKIKEKLKGQPDVLFDFYYSMIGSGKSFSTVLNYIGHITRFFNFVFPDGYNNVNEFYKQVKPVDINKYIASLNKVDSKGNIKKVSDSIKTVQWSALNTFFQFLVPDYMDVNPVFKTQRPKMKDNPKVTYLTSDEISKLLDYVEQNADRRFKNRDLCLLKLGFTTGLRVSAISQIDISDIDFKNNQIKVTEKGGVNESILFGNQLKHQLIEYINDREKYFKTENTDALFMSSKNKRLSVRRIGEIIEAYSKHVTDKKVTPHVMRHSCATNLYEKTGDIYLCASQLNHKNVATTQRYAEISNKKKKEAANILDNLI